MRPTRASYDQTSHRITWSEDTGLIEPNAVSAFIDVPAGNSVRAWHWWSLSPRGGTQQQLPALPAGAGVRDIPVGTKPYIVLTHYSGGYDALRALEMSAVSSTQIVRNGGFLVQSEHP